jgi:hypothetical protein
MADAPDLGSGAERCKGSSPFLGIWRLPPYSKEQVGLGILDLKR